MTHSPVIILGMHRSGTTMVTNMLEKLGLFVGEQKEPNNESLFFIRLNTWLLREANASWDNPHNFYFINDFFKQNTRRVIEMHFSSLKSIEYLGLSKFIRFRDIRNLDMPWGWKDPRNTITMDIWHEIFPDAKVLHIYRNPLDVAESLRKREAAKNAFIMKNGTRIKGFKLKKREYQLKRRTGYQDSFSLADIRENIRLWETYTTQALSLDSLLGKNIMHIRYETLLESFSDAFMPILDFIGMEASKKEVQDLVRDIKPDRKFAFFRDKSLVALYEELRNSELMKKLGYESLSVKA